MTNKFQFWLITFRRMLMYGGVHCTPPSRQYKRNACGFRVANQNENSNIKCDIVLLQHGDALHGDLSWKWSTGKILICMLPYSPTKTEFFLYSFMILSLNWNSNNYICTRSHIHPFLCQNKKLDLKQSILKQRFNKLENVNCTSMTRKNKQMQ